MNKSSGKKFGIILLKVILSLVVFAFVLGAGGKFGKALSGSSYTSVSMGWIFVLSTITPIWIGGTVGKTIGVNGASVLWRMLAASGGLISGILTWSISLFVSSSTFIGGLRSGAILVSVLVLISILRMGHDKAIQQEPYRPA